MLKGAERVAPMLDFKLRGIEVSLHGKRQDSPPKMVRIDDEIVVDRYESDQRLELSKCHLYRVKVGVAGRQEKHPMALHLLHACAWADS